MKKIFTLLVVAALMALGVVSLATGSASADDGYSQDPDNPTLVQEVPEGFSLVSEASSVNDCITTATAVYSRYTPGEDETTHQEWGSEERTRTFDPGQEETFHKVYSYKKKVVDYKTQYHFRKYTHTKTREWVKGTPAVNHWWNWSPNNSQGPQNYVPNFPSDERGTWQGPHVNGGPMQSTFGTFQTGGGNSPWFHREHISDAVPAGWGPWSEFGPWTPWVPESHTSWEDSDAPLGVPQFHGQGDDWYREWQAQFDGQTRQVESGFHWEYSGEVTEQLGAPWVLLPGYPKDVSNEDYVAPSYGPWSEWTVLSSGDLSEPTLPANTDTHEYRVTGPVVVGNGDGTEGFTEYVYTETVSGEPCEEPPTEEPPVDTPKTPKKPDVPTVVAAGLTGEESGADNGLLAGGAFGLGLLMMLGGAVALARGTK